MADTIYRMRGGNNDFGEDKECKNCVSYISILYCFSFCLRWTCCICGLCIIIEEWLDKEYWKMVVIDLCSITEENEDIFWISLNSSHSKTMISWENKDEIWMRMMMEDMIIRSYITTITIWRHDETSNTMMDNNSEWIYVYIYH